MDAHQSEFVTYFCNLFKYMAKKCNFTFKKNRLNQYMRSKIHLIIMKTLLNDFSCNFRLDKVVLK